MQNLEQKARKILKIGASAQRIFPFPAETVMGGLGEDSIGRSPVKKAAAV